MRLNQRLQIAVCSLSFALLSSTAMARPSPYAPDGVIGMSDDRYSHVYSSRAMYGLSNGPGRRPRAWRARSHRTVAGERRYRQHRWAAPRRSLRRAGVTTRTMHATRTGAAVRQRATSARARMVHQERRTAQRKTVASSTSGRKTAATTSPLVAEARRYLGTNPTGMPRLWCARFMNMVLARTGHRGTGSDWARSFAKYGRKIRGPQIGSIAVLSRGRNGGHVGVVSGVDKRGNPILVSGNHGRRVAEAAYPRYRIIAFVQPVPKSGMALDEHAPRKVIADTATVRKVRMAANAADVTADAHEVARAPAQTSAVDLPHWTTVVATVRRDPDHIAARNEIIDLPRWRGTLASVSTIAP